MSTVTTGSDGPKTFPPTRRSRGMNPRRDRVDHRRGRWQRPRELGQHVDELAPLGPFGFDGFGRVVDRLPDALEDEGEGLVAVVELRLEVAHRLDQGDLGLAAALELGVHADFDGRGELGQRGPYLGFYPPFALAPPHTPPARTTRGHSLAVITGPRTNKDTPPRRPWGAERRCVSHGASAMSGGSDGMPGGSDGKVDGDADRVPRDGRHQRRLGDEPAFGRQLRCGLHDPSRPDARGARLGSRAHRVRVGNARSGAGRGADRAQHRDAGGAARAPAEPLDPDVRSQDVRDARPDLQRPARGALHHRRQRPRTATRGRLPHARRALRPHA